MSVYLKKGRHNIMTDSTPKRKTDWLLAAFCLFMWALTGFLSAQLVKLILSIWITSWR